MEKILNQYPFQKLGTKFLENKKYAVLADKMGLGKTNQAVLAADRLFAADILIVCPVIAKINWQREFDMWSEYKRPIKILT